MYYPVPAPSPAAPIAAAPSQEDRLLAALAHLSFFTGAWLVAPIAIYLVKRKESRFVAFHAVQATLIHVFYGATAVGGTFLLLFASGVAAALSRSPGAAVVLPLLAVLVLVGAGLGWLATHCVLAYGAWQGRAWEVPVLGRIARGIVGADEGVAKG